jgi:gas vesicle protein
VLNEDKMMSEKNGDLLKGLFVGGLIGIALGLLFAPRSGKETRDDIKQKANDLFVKARDEYEKVVEKSKLACEKSVQQLKDMNLSAKEKAMEMENKVGELANQGIEAIQSNKNRFKKAIDAGLEAYREEINKEKV